ncbi:MAG: hypothetical protein KAU95_00605 [Candidatus Aenigmarchaeota archaeon]|nr:hypothetical protein [Candidatus Aenigmarchaeota archaeon]
MVVQDKEIENIIVCLINQGTPYSPIERLINRGVIQGKPIHVLYPRVIGHLDYGVFKECWNEKLKDEKSESEFFGELEEKWGVYHSFSENLIVLIPKDMHLKRKMAKISYRFKKIFTDDEKVLKYLNEIQNEEKDEILFKKALVFLLREGPVSLNDDDLSFLKISEEELKNILSRFVGKYGLVKFFIDKNEYYELFGFLSQRSNEDIEIIKNCRNTIHNFLCPHFGLDLVEFIETLPKEELDVFNVIFKDKQKWWGLLKTEKKIEKAMEEKGEDSKEAKELKAEKDIINKEIKEIEDESKEKLKNPANKKFLTTVDRIAEILKIPKERCKDIILNLKMKGLFSTPNHSKPKQYLYWVELSPIIQEKLEQRNK